MSSVKIGIYLNDHLAGSSSALELLGALGSKFSKVRDLSDELQREFESERGVLKNVMKTFGVSESPLRKAAAVVSAKFAELKLAVEGASDPEFFLFEGLEAVSVGIGGKRLLWMALDSVPNSELGNQNFKSLIEQADSQRTRIESFRVEAFKHLYAK